MFKTLLKTQLLSTVGILASVLLLLQSYICGLRYFPGGGEYLDYDEIFPTGNKFPSWNFIQVIRSFLSQNISHILYI